MSGFALFLLIVVLVAAVLGWRAGVLKQIGQIAGVVLGIAACRLFADRVNQMLFGQPDSMSDSMGYTILTYILIFIVVYMICLLLASLAHKMLKVTHIDILNHLAGAAFKAAEWVLLLSLLLNLVNTLIPLTSLAENPWFGRVLWFGPWLLGSDAVQQIGHAVSTAIGG